MTVVRKWGNERREKREVEDAKKNERARELGVSYLGSLLGIATRNELKTAE